MTDSPPDAPTLAPQRLKDPDDAARLVGVGFDFLMAQPLGRFVTPAQVLEHLDAALEPAQVRRVVRDHLEAALEREAERARRRADPLEAYLTPEAQALLRRQAEAPVKLEPAFLEGLVKQDAVRHLVRALVEETLGRFVQMLKPATGNGPLAKGLFARLGAQMEAQLTRAAAGFVSHSLDFVLGRLVQVLATPETGQRLGRLRREGLDVALGLSTGDLWSLAEGLDLSEVLGLLPGLWAHNLARPEIREMILAEARAALEREGQRSLAEVLEPRAVAYWRQRCIEVGAPLLGELASAAAFEQWLSG